MIGGSKMLEKVKANAKWITLGLVCAMAVWYIVEIIQNVVFWMPMGVSVALNETLHPLAGAYGVSFTGITNLFGLIMIVLLIPATLLKGNKGRIVLTSLSLVAFVVNIVASCVLAPMISGGNIQATVFPITWVMFAVNFVLFALYCTNKLHKIFPTKQSKAQ